MQIPEQDIDNTAIASFQILSNASAITPFDAA
jgi:hypothetical protein